MYMAGDGMYVSIWRRVDEQNVCSDLLYFGSKGKQKEV